MTNISNRSLRKSPTSATKKEPEEPKRCSPSCGSTKSADSGFSDSGESNAGGAKTSKVVNVDEDLKVSPNVSPKVSQVSQKCPEKVPAVDKAVGNISSLQEGLRMKREQCEESSMLSNPGVGGGNRSSNLLKAGDIVGEEDKAKKQFYFSEIKRRYQVRAHYYL